MRLSPIALLVCLLASAPSHAADITQAVPKEAYGYVVIPSASALDAKLQALGQRMNLPIPGIGAMLAAKPGLAAAAIFTFRIAWNEYLLASALSDRNTKTVPILIVNNMSEFNVEWGVIMATGMLLAIPPIIFTLLASRQIITGMTAGAVKG